MAWGAVLIAYVVAGLIWARADQMLAKPHNPPIHEKDKWDAVETKFNRRTIIWSIGLVAILFASGAFPTS